MPAARVVESSPSRIVVETVIPGAAAHDVYAAVSDVNRMREWSPEGRGRATEARALRPGDVFSGGNRRGARKWTTACTVRTADDPSAFAFDVSWAGMPVATWGYEFEQVADGVRVRETWDERRHGARGVVVKVAGYAGSGVWDRSTHNTQTMLETLNRLTEAFATPA